MKNDVRKGGSHVNKLSPLCNESGKADSKVPAIIAILIIVIVGFLAYKFVPPYMHNLEYEKEIVEVVNWDRFFDGSNPPTPDGVFEKVMETSKNMNIPLKEDHLNVNQTEDNRIRVKLNYTIDVKLPIYGVYKWTFYVDKLQDL